MEGVTATYQRRVKLNVHVHPSTVVYLDEIAGNAARPRGHIVDELVERAARAKRTGQMVCVDGQACQVNRRVERDVV